MSPTNPTMPSLKDIKFSLPKTSIHCDACNDEFETEWKDVPWFHNKECTVCKSGILVDDKDLEVWKMMDNLYKELESVLDAAGHVPIALEDGTDITFTINSKDFKDKE